MQAIIHTISSPAGLQLQTSTLGAAWISCRVPLPGGERREVLLGLSVRCVQNRAPTPARVIYPELK